MCAYSNIIYTPHKSMGAYRTSSANIACTLAIYNIEILLHDVHYNYYMRPPYDAKWIPAIENL